jgi:hypothetical protein
MSEFHKLLAVSAWFSNVAFAGPGLDQAEVRLPYAEFKTLISESSRPAPTPISPPSGPSQWLFQGPPAESKFLAAESPKSLSVSF